MMYCNESARMRKSENKITLCSTGNCINQIIYNEHDCTVRHAEKMSTFLSVYDISLQISTAQLQTTNGIFLLLLHQNAYSLVAMGSIEPVLMPVLIANFCLCA